MVHASSSSEVSEKLKEAIKNPPDCLKYYAHPEEEEEEQEQQLVTPQDLARQRWKILCLVKTSDTVADETIRQEKIKERVDEWMSKMVSKMKVDEEVTTQENGSHQGSSSGRSSPSTLSSDYKASLEELKRQTQREQLRRIRQREQVERERERLMVLEGKIAIKPEHMQDPLLRIHSQCLQMEKQAKELQARKLKKKERKAKRKAIKMKWSTAKDKLKLNNFNMFENDNNDTVVANLLYDEKNDKLCSSSTSLLLDSNNAAEENETQKDPFVHPNPVFQAFDGATGVDDLYRIAEIYVNPASYYEFS